jgi:type II secretory pathway predicted ATPase ExeA
MYRDFYHLKSEPFGTHPHTGTFFISQTHKEAWNYLLSGIESQEPFLLLTGEYGMGKTLLCFRLMKYLQEKGDARVEYIPSSNEGFGGILRRIAIRQGIRTLPEDEEILQDMIYDRFRAEGNTSRFYLIIDDAQELDTQTLTKLKHLSNFNYDEFFPMIMIFVGHPSFLKDLSTSALRSLNQRIKRRCQLARFSLEDTKNYIFFRLLKSGATGVPAFPDETVKKIFEFSGGVPRLIHNICDTCLQMAAARQLISIPPAVADEAKRVVEASLVGAENETGEAAPLGEATASGPKIPPAGKAESLGPAPPLSAGEEKQEAVHPRSLIFDRRMRTTILIVAAALMLFSLALLSRLFMGHEKAFVLFPSLSRTEQEKTPLPPRKIQADGQIPVEERTEKRAAPVAVPKAEEIETLALAPAEGTAGRPGEAKGLVPAGGETAAAGIAKPAVFHPFLLRASSYQQQEQALAEMSEIRQMGLTPYLVKADVGDMGTLWRIYIGFFSTEEEARRIKTQYRLPHVSVQRSEYACQVGEYAKEADVAAVFDRLKQTGHFPYVIQKDRNRFRLYVGAYEKKAEAEALREDLQRKGFGSQVVRR